MIKNRKDVCRGKGGFTSAGVNWCQCKLVWVVEIENRMAGPQKINNRDLMALWLREDIVLAEDP